MVDAIQWEQPLSRLPRVMLWFVALGVVAALIWAAFAKVSVYAQVRGTLAPQVQPLQVNVPRAGRVVESKVQMWQKVKKGQVLFTLDALARDSQDAELQLSIQQNAALQAKQDIAAAQIEWQNKLRAKQSAETVFKTGALSRLNLEAASADLATAAANLARAKSQLASAQAQLNVLTRNQKISVVSPMDGQIMQIGDLHFGQTLAAGQSALGLLPEGVPLVFRGSAAEKDRPKLQADAKVQIAWNGYPRQKYGVTYGVLAGVAPTSEVAQGGQITYQVEVTLPDNQTSWHLGERPLLPGMAGEAHVLSSEHTVLRLFWDWVRGADPWS